MKLWVLHMNSANSSSTSDVTLINNLGENQTEEDLKKIGWAGKPMQVKVPDDYEKWRKVYLRCLQMRRNIVASNFEGNLKFLIRSDHSK